MSATATTTASGNVTKQQQALWDQQWKVYNAQLALQQEQQKLQGDQIPDASGGSNGLDSLAPGSSQIDYTTLSDPAYATDAGPPPAMTPEQEAVAHAQVSLAQQNASLVAALPGDPRASSTKPDPASANAVVASSGAPINTGGGTVVVISPELFGLGQQNQQQQQQQQQQNQDGKDPKDANASDDASKDKDKDKDGDGDDQDKDKDKDKDKKKHKHKWRNRLILVIICVVLGVLVSQLVNTSTPTDSSGTSSSGSGDPSNLSCGSYTSEKQCKNRSGGCAWYNETCVDMTCSTFSGSPSFCNNSTSNNCGYYSGACRNLACANVTTTAECEAIPSCQVDGGSCSRVVKFAFIPYLNFTILGLCLLYLLYKFYRNARPNSPVEEEIEQEKKKRSFKDRAKRIFRKAKKKVKEEKEDKAEEQTKEEEKAENKSNEVVEEEAASSDGDDETEEEEEKQNSSDDDETKDEESGEEEKVDPGDRPVQDNSENPSEQTPPRTPPPSTRQMTLLQEIQDRGGIPSKRANPSGRRSLRRSLPRSQRKSTKNKKKVEKRRQ